MHYSDVITSIYLWTYRISILFLVFLSFIHLRRKRIPSAIIIFIGLLTVLAAILIDYITWWFLRLEIVSYYVFEKVKTASQLLSSVGYLISTYGCFREIFKSKKLVD